MKFISKRVIIEAEQYTSEDDIDHLRNWMSSGACSSSYLPRHTGTDERVFLIHTLEGDMEAEIGDWIIKGLAGEFYPCKPEIFEQKYERIE